MSKRGSEFSIIWRGLAVGLGFMWLMGFAIGYRNSIDPWILLLAAIGCLVVAKWLEK